MEAVSVTALLIMKQESERVKNKNMRSLDGKPLCYWVINTLTKIPEIERISVNTDGDRIAAYLHEAFPSVVVKQRPPELCGQHVAASALTKYDLSQSGGEHFLITHVTNPFIRSETIKKAIDLYFKNIDTYDSLFGATRIQQRLYDKNGTPINHDPYTVLRTQDLEPIFEDNANIYLFSRSSFNKTGTRIGLAPYLFEMDSIEAFDIDEENDFKLAEALSQMRKSEKNDE
jgi:CMP-N-acetylneuraminic acid synthetase